MDKIKYLKSIDDLPEGKKYVISSLTVERVKRGYKPSKYGRCSLFRSCIDMCYILSLSKTFVFLMRVRMEVLVMIS